MKNMSTLNPLQYPVCLSQPLRLDHISAWIEHIPFGMFMVDILRPKVLVELGTHTGVSYSAFCQAVKRLELNCRCYAIDTWTGDEQAGHYGPEILADLHAHHDPRYGEFSSLVQSTFDDAVKYFPDASIDLLHIDGLHTHDAVKHDFETWLPKLSEHGVVMFHDINVRERDFGVWKLWADLQQKYPHFEFFHGHGLGVLRVGNEPVSALEMLFSISDDQAKRIREFFFTLGFRLSMKAGEDYKGQVLGQQLNEKDQAVQMLSTQVAEKERVVQMLSTQVAEKERVVQMLSMQVAEKEQATQMLSVQVAEKEQAAQALSVEVIHKDRDLEEIRNSKAWRLAMLLRRIRVMLIPPNSRRARILRFLISPFVKIRSNWKLKEDLTLIRSSGLFDKDWYLTHNPDIARAKIDPVRHYLQVGGLQGRDPGPNFNSAWYLETYADVKNAWINPLVHYLRSGRQERRLTRPVQIQENLSMHHPSDLFDPEWYLASNPDVAEAGLDPYQHFQQYGKFEGRVGRRPKTEIQAGGVRFEPSRGTVLVVSHEASPTGAPILSLNIVQHLQKKYNVVSMLLGDGSIAENFREASTFMVGPMPLKANPFLADLVIEQISKMYSFKFAIVNSIESRVVLHALMQRSVPAINLVHEFAIYTRPQDAFLEAILWSQETIFSTPVTYENAISEHPELAEHSSHIIPQGHCVLPTVEGDANSLFKEEARVLSKLRPEGSSTNTIVILGAGTVQLRKGVDLFIDCAARLLRSGQTKNFRFVWIGNGYNPDDDLAYSVYLADQINRAELPEHIFFMENTSNIEVAYKAADIVLISSRLDPLPNVAIDAMMHRIPLVCFDKTTGVADILTTYDLADYCVAPYLDTENMVAKIIAFMESKSLRQEIGERLRQLALKEFNMEHYAAQLEELGLASSVRIGQEQLDASEIAKSGLARMDYYQNQQLTAKLKDPNEMFRYYVRTWASGIRRRKLFPGFHPGIFLEQSGMCTAGSDPLATYLRAKQPNGPWRYEVLTSEETKRPVVQPEIRIALHIHVYYPDLLPDMLTRLNKNHVRPDLFISLPKELTRREVQETLKSYSGKVIEIQVVPNRGRDFGPFLTAFGATFVDHYDVAGHLHTKKTANIQDGQMGEDWRLFLLENLLGGKSNMADIILERMVSDPSIGIIFPDDPHIVGWNKNRRDAEELGKQLGLDSLPNNFLFPVGTMFWARVGALTPIFELGLDWQDYPMEPLPDDGSILHALERLLPFVVSKRGFRLMLTNVAGITR